jgi:hypothetical protein
MQLTQKAPSDPSCPEFPDLEWTNILAGQAVNLNAVLTGYYSTSNNDESA